MKCLRLLERHIIKIFIFFVLLSIQLSAQADTAKASSDTTQYKFEMQKSPLGALLRSALVPGWGQIYNESYWKAPVVWGFIGYYIYFWIRNNNSYIDFRNSYRKSLAEKSPTSSYYLQWREFYHDQRDLFTIYIAIVYFLNLLDAYVDAQLFDFNIQENYGSTAQFNIRIRF
jgi:hypothetical protein